MQTEGRLTLLFCRDRLTKVNALDKVTSGYRCRGCRVNVKVTTDDKLVILVHFFRTFANFSYSFDRIELGTHRNDLRDHVPNSVEAEF